jgi:hypothetical protein
MYLAQRELYGPNAFGAYGCASPSMGEVVDYADAQSDFGTFGGFGDADACAEARANRPGWSPNDPFGTSLTCLDPTLSPAQAQCCKNAGKPMATDLFGKAEQWVLSKVPGGGGGNTQQKLPPLPAADDGLPILPLIIAAGAVYYFAGRK